MRKHLKAIIDYYSYFSYSPTFGEIYTFFPTKISKKNLLLFLENEVKLKKLIRLRRKAQNRASQRSDFNFNLELEFPHYTLPQYSIDGELTAHSQQPKVINRTIQIYLYLLKILPLVRFVGITGKSAVEGIRNTDDIDLFIITKTGFVWTTRCIVVLLAKILGIHGGVGVCLNLFFDEQNICIPTKKQNSYIAHELLQMKPIVDKNNTYSALMEVNGWLYSIFPNSRDVIPTKVGIQKQIYGNYIDPVSQHGMTSRTERLLKSIQLPIITRNKTSFMITPTQLWLFRQDYEKNLRKVRLVK